MSSNYCPATDIVCTLAQIARGIIKTDKAKSSHNNRKMRGETTRNSRPVPSAQKTMTRQTVTRTCACAGPLARAPARTHAHQHLVAWRSDIKRSLLIHNSSHSQFGTVPKFRKSLFENSLELFQVGKTEGQGRAETNRLGSIRPHKHALVAQCGV